MTQRHKHADLIIAWANEPSLALQVRAPIMGRYETRWSDVEEGTPIWDENLEYRIKPEPKPDCRVPLRLARLEGGGFVLLDRGPDNFIATFDGETGALKSVEILK